MDFRLKSLQRLATIQNLLAAALLLKFTRYTVYPPFWDASSYLLMGKYLFSGGSAGLIEPFRPIVWPLTLGFFWKSGVDQILAGRLLEIFLGVGNIALVYAIGVRAFDRTVGLLAAALLALSPTFFIWGNSLYADIPASFLGLLCVYLFLKDRPFLSGAVGAVAFFTKFPQILPLAIVVGALSFQTKPFRFSMALWRFSAAFILASLPFLILHQTLYGHPFYPFIDGLKSYPRFLTAWPEGMLKCVAKLLGEECWLLGLALLEFKRFAAAPRCRKNIAILLAGMLSLVWVGKFGSDHHRLTVTALPYLYLSCSAALADLRRGWWPQRRAFAGALLAITFAAIGSQTLTIASMRFPENELMPFQRYILQHAPVLHGKNIWVSGPKYLVFTDLPAGELMYDPTVNTQEIAALRRKLSQADYIFLDSRDLPCNPPADELCRQARRQLITEIERDFIGEFYAENPELGITVGVFRKK